jgi:L-idonate 5-dehydrogenase
VTVTDLQPAALALAERIGVDETVDVSDPSDAARLAGRSATFDVAIEASGAVAALATAADALRSGGRIVQLGMPPANEFPVPMSTMMSRELDYRMSLRYGAEFPEAVRLLSRFPELEELITSVVPLSEAWRAFELAADRTASSKVLLDLTA